MLELAKWYYNKKERRLAILWIYDRPGEEKAFQHYREMVKVE